MSTNKPKRISGNLTPTDEERLRRQRALVAQELPDLVQRDRMRREAQEELTLSGELRRAIHASKLSLIAIASRAGITPTLLDEFLTGERTLRSDVMDRVATTLGVRFQPMPSTPSQGESQ
jgi:hypothetical protein